jgi:hypothetical protein
LSTAYFGRKTEEILKIKFFFFSFASLLLPLAAWSGHTLKVQEQKVLERWLTKHPEYRVAADDDCDCADDIKQTRAGSGGAWKPIPDYHPYAATGDFNGHGVEDFAVVLIDRRSKADNRFALVVFNGPFNVETPSPAFFQSRLNLSYDALFYGPPRPKPYRLLVGRFESDSGSLLIPHGRGYKLGESSVAHSPINAVTGNLRYWDWTCPVIRLTRIYKFICWRIRESASHIGRSDTVVLSAFSPTHHIWDSY